MSYTPCCKKKYPQSLLSGAYFQIYRCKDCGKLWCHKCGEYGDRCPNCSSKKKDWHSDYYMP